MSDSPQRGDLVVCEVFTHGGATLSPMMVKVAGHPAKVETVGGYGQAGAYLVRHRHPEREGSYLYLYWPPGSVHLLEGDPASAAWEYIPPEPEPVFDRFQLIEID